jgi:RimJ/RimL family protein N-acetyltransferase
MAVVHNAPAVIPTARFVGTRLADPDLRDFQDFYGDPAVMATLSSDARVWSKRESAELFKRHLEHWNEHGFGTWMFRDGEGGPFVARAGLRAVDMGSGPEVELFYGVDSGRWGDGIATEVAKSVVRMAFESVGLEELVGFTLPENAASQRVLEKCGFRHEGDIRHAELRHLLFRLPAPGPSTTEPQP